MAPSSSAFRNVHKSPSSRREFWLQTNSFVSALPLNFGRVQMSHWALQSRDVLGHTEHFGLTSFWCSFSVIPELNSPFSRSDLSKSHKWIFFPYRRGLNWRIWTSSSAPSKLVPQWQSWGWQNLPPKDFGRAQGNKGSHPSPGWRVVRRGFDSKVTPQSI